MASVQSKLLGVAYTPQSVDTLAGCINNLWHVNALQVMAVAACVFQYFSNIAVVAQWSS